MSEEGEETSCLSVKRLYDPVPMDDDTPATRGDLQRLEQRLERSMNEKFKNMNEKFKNVDDGIDRVLAVLINVDKKLTKKVENHEERIKTLEQALV